VAASEIEKACAGLIGKNGGQFDGEDAFIDRVADGLQVGATAGAEDAETESTVSGHFAWRLHRERGSIG
jgi:hypothetical protein